MSMSSHFNDSIHWHVAEITARVVAESGIPTDRFHVGKIIFQSLKDDPDRVLQIDAGTDEFETNGEALLRSIKFGICLKAMGLKKGDVMVLMAPTNLDLVVPFYAALYLGIVTCPIDMTLAIGELTDTFETAKPKIVFCQNENVSDVVLALNNSGCKAHIVTFGKSKYNNFKDLLDQNYDDNDVTNFRCADFNASETLAAIVATSGTTGTPKLAATTHKNFIISGSYFWIRSMEFPPFTSALVVAPLQWLSALIMYVCGPYLKFTRLQSSQPLTREHIYYMINNYKPQFSFISPTLMTTLIKPGDRDTCDFTCFRTILLGGSAVHLDLISEIKKVSPRTNVVNSYGMTEMTGLAFSHGHSSTPASCGKPAGCFQHRLIDVNTGKDILDPYVNGELWVKGPGLFKEYYNQPKATNKVFEDGWFKTGDIFYRDETWNFYFVERIKLLLKYKNHQISPMEVEAVILQHPQVLDVVVTGFPDKECGELPVACVVPASDYQLTAQDIKDLVKGTQ